MAPRSRMNRGLAKRKPLSARAVGRPKGPLGPCATANLMTRLLLLCSGFVLTACLKNVDTTIAGSDDSTMDSYRSQLEEYRTKTDVSCNDACNVKKKVCGISASACAMSDKAADRQDFQKICVSGQEECARFNESCANCAK